jgi:hypothetical protein
VNIFGGFLVTAAHAGHVQEEGELRPCRGRISPHLLLSASRALLFILALRGLSSPAHQPRRAIAFGMVGMAIAMLTHARAAAARW